MTRNEIIATKTGARELYKKIPCPAGVIDAAREPLTLGQMVNDFVKLDDGERVTYAVAYCRACIDHIMSLQNRRETFSTEIRNQTAKMWVQTFPEWTFADVRLFPHLLVTGFLATTTASGADVAGFITFDIPGFFEKLHAYNKKRPGYIQRMNQAGINKAMGNMDGSTDEGRQRPPIWEIDPAARQFDLLGVEHPPDWDYKAYWMARASPDETAHIAAKIHEINFKIHF